MAKRGLKSIAGVILGVVVAVPVAAALVVWLWRDSVAEWVVVNYLIPEIGFDAAFDGPFDVDITNTLDVAASDIRFTARTPGQTIKRAEIARLGVSLDLGRILRGVPLLRRLEVSDATFVLQQDEEGQTPPPVQGPRGFRLPFIESAELTNIRVLQYGADPEAPPLHEIQLVKLLETTKGGEVEIDGALLWDGSELAIEGKLGGPENALDSSPPFPMDLVVRAPEFTFDLDGTIADVLAGRGMDLQVALDAPEASRLAHYAHQDIPDVGPFKLKARLIGDLDAPGLTELTAIIGGTEGFLAQAEGAIERLDELEGADLALSLWVADDAWFRPVMPEDKPLPQSVEVAARLVTTADKAVLEGITAKAILPDGVTLDAKGTVAAAELTDLTAPEAIDVDLEFNSPTTLAADTWLALGIPEIGPVRVVGRLNGSLQDLSLFGVELRSGREDGVLVVATADLEHIDFDNPLGDSPMQVVLIAPDSSNLSAIFETEIPSLGPVEFRFISTVIVDNGEVLADRWDDLEVRIGTAGAMLITATGRIADVNTNKSPVARGLDLDVEVDAADFATLSEFIDTDLPGGGAAQGRLAIEGDADAIAVSLETFEISFPGDLTVAVSGAIGQYDASDGSYRDVNLAFELQAPETGPALAGLGVDLPITGPLDGTFVLTSEGESLSLTRTALEAGPRTEPTLALDGAVRNVDDPASLKANAAFRINMTRLTRDLADGEGVDLGLASGAFAVSGAEEGYAIDRLNVAFDRIGALSISATGAIDPANETTPVELDIEMSADSLAQLAADPDDTALPDSTFAADGRLVAGAERYDYGGTVKIGTSDFATDLLIDLNQPTEVTARIRGQQVHLADLGLQLDPSQDEGVEVAAVRDQAVATPLLFGAVPIPIERLGDIDLALSIETGEIVGRDFSMTRLTGQYDLLDGRLTAKTRAEYPRGQLELNGEVDSSQEPPSMSVSAIGDDLRVDHVLAQFGLKPVLEGDLHLNVAVSSTGRAPREIAESLNGNATLAVDQGRVQLGDLERISSNRFQAKRAHARRSEWTELTCGVVRLNIENGIAETDGLVLATPRVVIGGSGQFDLREETMDLVLAADREFSTAAGFDKPVRVHGPLTDPEVTANISGHVGDAALTGGEVAGMVALPFIFVPVRVASSLRSQLREQDTSSACLLNGEVNGDTFNNKDAPEPIN